MTRIQITGFFEPDDDEIDEDSSTGLTEEAYLRHVVDEDGTGLKVADLTDVEIEVVDD
jgi:hypothetical protein